MVSAPYFISEQGGKYPHYPVPQEEREREKATRRGRGWKQGRAGQGRAGPPFSLGAAYTKQGYIDEGGAPACLPACLPG